MHLRKKNLKLLFAITLLLTLVVPTLFPSIKLCYFFPLIAISFYQMPLNSSLWLSMFLGALIDLLSDGQRIGFYAAIYLLTTLLLYPQRVNFFADHLSTLPLMVFFYSFTATSIETLYYLMTSRFSSLSLKWIFSDLFLMPAQDALFSFLVALLPSLLFCKRERKGNEYFMR